MQNQKKVITIFLSPGGIGEVILQTPFYKALKANFPDYSVTAFLFSKLSVVLENNPYVDKIVTYKSKKDLLQTILSLRNNFYNECFVFDKSWKSILISRLFIKCARLTGFKRSYFESLPLNKKIVYKATKHESCYYLDMLSGYRSYSTKPEMFPNPNDIDAIRKLDINTAVKKVALLPGGANNIAVGDEPFRRWPKERYKEIALKLIEHGYELIFVGGPNDIPITNFIKEDLDPDKIYDFTGKLRLHQSGLLLSKAALIICQDSGLMHLASCFNPNLLCLFGITSPETLLPQVANAQYLWSDKDIYSVNVRLYGTRSIHQKLKYRYFSRLSTADVLNKTFEMLSTTKVY